MKLTKEQAKILWCPQFEEDRCIAEHCMLWVELNDGVGCCGYSHEAAWALFSQEEEKP